MPQRTDEGIASPNRYGLVGALIGVAVGIVVALFQDRLLNWTLFFFLISVPYFFSFLLTGDILAPLVITGLVNVLYLAPLGFLLGKLIAAKVRRRYLFLAVAGVMLLHALFLYLDAELIGKALSAALQQQ